MQNLNNKTNQILRSNTQQKVMDSSSSDKKLSSMMSRDEYILDLDATAIVGSFDENELKPTTSELELFNDTIVNTDAKQLKPINSPTKRSSIGSQIAAIRRASVIGKRPSLCVQNIRNEQAQNKTSPIQALRAMSKSNAFITPEMQAHLQEKYQKNIKSANSKKSSRFILENNSDDDDDNNNNTNNDRYKNSKITNKNSNSKKKSDSDQDAEEEEEDEVDDDSDDSNDTEDEKKGNETEDDSQDGHEDNKTDGKKSSNGGGKTSVLPMFTQKILKKKQQQAEMQKKLKTQAKMMKEQRIKEIGKDQTSKNPGNKKEKVLKFMNNEEQRLANGMVSGAGGDGDGDDSDNSLPNTNLLMHRVSSSTLQTGSGYMPGKQNKKFLKTKLCN
jgi:hypothetical protein